MSSTSLCFHVWWLQNKPDNHATDQLIIKACAFVQLLKLISQLHLIRRLLVKVDMRRPFPAILFSF